jgi:6-phosphogluconolactonase
MTQDIRIVDNAAGLHAAAADVFALAVADAASARPECAVALSGGSTPRGLYALLADDPARRARVPWKRIRFFWGDERHVPPDHPDSNFRLAHEVLLSRVEVSGDQVWRIRGEYPDARRAADEYEQDLRRAFRLAPGQRPRFDLVLLGLGSDGHTASLFPGSAALTEQERLVVAVRAGSTSPERITLTAPVLNDAALVVFLVQGAEKAAALRAVLEEPRDPDRWPAQLVQPRDGRLLWIVDRAAAAMLGRARS